MRMPIPETICGFEASAVIRASLAKKEAAPRLRGRAFQESPGLAERPDDRVEVDGHVAFVALEVAGA